MFGSKQTYTVEGVAQFTLPEDWNPRPREQQGAWTAFEIRKAQTWRFGSGDPLEVHGFVVAAPADAKPDDLESAMDYCFREVQVNTLRFDEFSSMKTGTRTTWMSEGSYHIGSNHDPEKVIFLRSIDPVKMTVLVARVYGRKISHEKLRAIEAEFFGSFQYLEGRARHFGSHPRPGLVSVNRHLRSLDMPAAVAGERVEAANGWVYYLVADELVMGRRLGDSPAWVEERTAPGIGSLRYSGGKWQSSGEEVPARWAYKLALDGDRMRRYYFAMSRFDLTKDVNLAAWMAQAAKVDEAFRAGR